MGEISTPYSRIAAVFLTLAANDVGKAKELVGQLVSAHTLNRQGRSFLESLDPEMKKIVEDELIKINPVAKKILRGGGGYTDYLSPEAGPQAQTLASDVDHLVSGAIRHNLPEAKARRVLQEIAAEIIRRNNW